MIIDQYNLVKPLLRTSKAVNQWVNANIAVTSGFRWQTPYETLQLRTGSETDLVTLKYYFLSQLPVEVWMLAIRGNPIMVWDVFSEGQILSHDPIKVTFKQLDIAYFFNHETMFKIQQGRYIPADISTLAFFRDMNQRFQTQIVNWVDE